MAPLAFLGTGLLGGAFVEAALGRGEQVAAWNRTPAKARALEARGARFAATPAEAARGATRVHLVLRDDASVEEVLAALRPGLDPAAVIVDHTTTQPAFTAARARRLGAEGVRYLHCPVFIGPAAARKGEGVILASGPRALFEEVRGGLERQAARVVYLGERPDLAAVHKLCGNALILGITGLVADTYAVAEGAGVPPAEVMKLFDLLPVGAIVSGRGRSIAARNYVPGFELAMARKDLRLMLETARTPLGTLPGLAARMDALIAQGRGADDIAALGADATG